MSIIRITKTFDFEMGHALTGYDGKCANIHGHSYRLEVTLIGKPETNLQSPKIGMVMDFSDLKKIVRQEVIDQWDHALVLREDDKRAGYFSADDNILGVTYQPTCENLLIDIVSKLNPALKKFGELHSVVLHETATSYAAWFSSDNP